MTKRSRYEKAQRVAEDERTRQTAELLDVAPLGRREVRVLVLGRNRARTAARRAGNEHGARNPSQPASAGPRASRGG